MCVLDTENGRPEIISVHLVDSRRRQNLRRRRLGPADVAGLRSSEAVLATEFAGTTVPKLQLQRGGLVCFWDDREALQDFVEWHPAAESLNGGTLLTLAPQWASGRWPGLTTSNVPTSSLASEAGTGLGVEPFVVGLTIGLPRLRTFPELSRRNVDIERQLLADPDMLWGTALFSRKGMTATLSVWRSAQAMRNFGQSGAHGAAVGASPLPDSPRGPKRYDDGTRFMRTGAFIRCGLVDVAGHLSGRNPQPALVASA